MRTNLRNLIRQNKGKPRVLRGTLELILDHMEELKERQANGDGDNALTEFLVVWCIKEPTDER